MNSKVVLASIVGIVIGFLAACGPEYGECGRGNTECELARAQTVADATGKDVYVDVDVYNSTYNDPDINVNVDVDQSQAQAQNQTNGGCTTCGNGGSGGSNNGTGGTSGAGGNAGVSGQPGTGGASGSSGNAGSGGSCVDAGHDPIVCKYICSKYKVKCNGKKVCIKKVKVCKKSSEW